MPRTARLDAPGALHHVVARGIERREIFFDDEDRDDFVARLADLAASCAFEVYAWALMPNHVHLLVRTGERPLERSMRVLLSGFATRLNLRHDRAGHVFQNRYKSTLCEEETYFLALIRYIHRNPIPALVPDVAALGEFPYTGHPDLIGRRTCSWYPREEILRWFDTSPTEARRRYLEFLAAAADVEPAPDLEGGGLRRSRGGWDPVDRLEKGRERFRYDERILGSPRFVQRILGESSPPATVRMTLPEIVEAVCVACALDPNAVRGEGRSKAVCAGRAGIAYLWCVRFGGSIRSVAHHLGLAEAPMRRAVARGRRDAARWDALIERRSAIEPNGRRTLKEP